MRKHTIAARQSFALARRLPDARFTIDDVESDLVLGKRPSSSLISCGIVTCPFVVMRMRGPAWQPNLPMRGQAAWDAHAAFINGLAADGFVVPLTFRTNCSAAAVTSSLVAGGSKLWSGRMLRHMWFSVRWWVRG